MKKWVAVVGLLFWVMSSGCGGMSSGKVLVDINGDKITEGDLKFLGEINPRIQSQIDNPAGQRKILDNLVEQELLYAEALKEGINRDPKVKAKVDLYRRVIIAQSLVDAETEKAAKKYYDEHQDDFKKLSFSQIMVKYSSPDEIKKAKKDEKLRTEEDALKAAQEIKARLGNGEEFAKVAQEVSDDTATKARGGDMGAVSKGDKRVEARGFAPLLDQAFELKVGEVSGPIKTDKGYHIIVVTKGLELQPFDEAKQAILFQVRDSGRNDLLAKLKKDAKIVFPEEEKLKAEAQKKAKESGETKAEGKPAGEAGPAEAKPEGGAAVAGEGEKKVEAAPAPKELKMPPAPPKIISMSPKAPAKADAKPGAPAIKPDNKAPVKKP